MGPSEVRPYDWDSGDGTVREGSLRVSVYQDWKPGTYGRGGITDQGLYTWPEDDMTHGEFEYASGQKLRHAFGIHPSGRLYDMWPGGSPSDELANKVLSEGHSQLWVPGYDRDEEGNISRYSKGRYEDSPYRRISMPVRYDRKCPACGEQLMFKGQQSIPQATVPGQSRETYPIHECPNCEWPHRDLPRPGQGADAPYDVRHQFDMDEFPVEGNPHNDWRWSSEHMDKLDSVEQHLMNKFGPDALDPYHKESPWNERLEGYELGEQPLPSHVYRAMDEDHFQQSMAQGYHQSDERGNYIGQAKQMPEMWNEEPPAEGTVASRWAYPSYLSNAASGQGRVVKIRVHPEDGWQNHPYDEEGGYLHTFQPIPTDRFEDWTDPISSSNYRYGKGLQPSWPAAKLEEGPEHRLGGVLHEPGEWGRGMLDLDNGEVHTWPEEWGTHGAMADSNAILRWAPFVVRPDGSLSQSYGLMPEHEQQVRRVVGDGDGYVTCDQGHQHWGTNGAAGALLRHPQSGRYFLTYRSPETHEGDCWGIPGGAMMSHEQPHEAALRETAEEVGHYPEALIRNTTTDDHGGWAYHTVHADVPQMFQSAPQNWETSQTGWFSPEEIDSLNLHPGFAQTWTQLRR